MDVCVWSWIGSESARPTFEITKRLSGDLVRKGHFEPNQRLAKTLRKLACFWRVDGLPTTANNREIAQFLSKFANLRATTPKRTRDKRRRRGVSELVAVVLTVGLKPRAQRDEERSSRYSVDSRGRVGCHVPCDRVAAVTLAEAAVETAPADGDDAPQPPVAPICRCGATTRWQTDPTRCARRHPLKGHKGLNYDRGMWLFIRKGKMPVELEKEIAAFRNQVMADMGGRDNLTELEHAAVEQRVDAEVVHRMIMAKVYQQGLFTAERGDENKLHKMFVRNSMLILRQDREIGRGRRERAVHGIADAFRSPVLEGEAQ